jgi:hypothetical protein
MTGINSPVSVNRGGAVNFTTHWTTDFTINPPTLTSFWVQLSPPPSHFQAQHQVFGLPAGRVAGSGTCEVWLGLSLQACRACPENVVMSTQGTFPIPLRQGWESTIGMYGWSMQIHWLRLNTASTWAIRPSPGHLNPPPEIQIHRLFDQKVHWNQITC